jgi:hypothetical protein
MSNAYPDASVYIAYARADGARVEPVVTLLRAAGFSIHFEGAAAHGSGNYVDAVQQALRQARTLVVFVSAASAQSPWVEAETRAFQASMAREDGRKLIPVRLDATPLPLALAAYQAIDGANATPATLADAIARAIVGAQAQPALAESEESEEIMRGVPAAAGSSNDGIDWDAMFDAQPDAAAPDIAFPDMDEEPASAPAPLPQPEAAAPPSAPAASPPYAPPAPAPQPVTQPGRTRRNSGAPPPRPKGVQPPQPTRLEQVTFTAYHPREMQPQQWQPLVVYLALNDAATMALVASAAAERLAGKLNQFRAGRAEKAAGIARGTALRIIPSLPGFAFNPSYLDVTWQEDVQQHEFRMSAVSAQPGQAANGVVQFYQGMLLRAEVPISIFVGHAAARLDAPDAYAQAIARAYRRIFASYSHQDMPVVESCESAARTMGDQYLRDVNLLQSGQQWDPRLIQAINDADIFQLFWSKRAAASPYVAREWQHALMLLPTRPNFIRPVYWTRQLYPTPPELNALHFQPLSLSSLGWGPLRAAWYELRNR